MQLSRRLQLLLAAAVLIMMTYRPLAEVAVDWLWFDSLGYLDIFLTTLNTKVAMWAAGFLISALFIVANVRQAVSGSPINYMRVSTMMGEQGLPPDQLRSLLRVLVVVWVVVPSLAFGGGASRMWLELLTWQNAATFGTVDPVFAKDIGFYVFELPLWNSLQDQLIGLVFITLIPLSGYYFLRDMSGTGRVPELSKMARAHVFGLVSLLFMLMAWGWWLDRYLLLYDRTGAVWGAGYADLTARLPAYQIMAGLSVVMGLLMLGAGFRKGWRQPIIGFFAYAVVYFGGVVMTPSWVQDWYVSPSELGIEREYIDRNIEFTRAAYALDRIEVKPFEAATDLDMDDIVANPLTIENVRVWDDRPLLDTYSQIQEIRLYYGFADVDIDRYMINGKPRQVMLSARELDSDALQGRTWVNEHFQFTHGYGLTMSPVNVVTSEGLPELFIKDLPPVSTVDLEVTRPEVYYGELTDRYAFVRTGEKEFDYPLGDDNVYTTYEGKGGVGVGSLARKALFAMHFNNINVLLSSYLTDESRVMFRRRVKERVAHLAPFLRYDEDPYLVLVDGRMVWMQDAYTITDGYPYSEPTQIDRFNRFNYIRNSVKVVVDAYHGDVSFYVSDPSDPIIQVYERIFPGSFKAMDQMDEGLKAHVRYPVGFFDVQANMYRAYHMLDANVFYNREDMWELPRELYAGKDQKMESYYLIMKLPGEEKAEFILLVPFVPTNRDNMISWLAARCDPDNYGSLVLYQFPKQKLIYGPRQIEARIDQDPDISQQITLWSQSGSRVVRGNLLVIPIGDSLMYVEPLYLQAETSQLPELKRVLVSYENRIAMRPTLDEALRAVFAPGAPGQEQAIEAATEAPPQLSEQAQQVWQELAGQATSAYDRAVSRQKDGDWAGYGAAINELGGLLEQLSALAGDGEDEGTLEVQIVPEQDDAPEQDGAPAPE